LVELNLFNDASFTVFLERVKPAASGNYTWFGRIADREHSQVILVVNETGVTGNVRFEGSLIQIRPLGDGLHVVKELNPIPLAEDECATRPEDIGQPAFDAAGLPRSPDDGSSLDIMVVYTPAAANGSADIGAEIQLAVDETNQSYLNSGIDTQLNLVHTAQVNYTESGDAYTDRNRLQDPADGYLDEVHALRDTYCADMVSLWVEYLNACGVAYIMTSVSTSFENYAFMVVRRPNCATGYFSFGHEFGHLQSARHDWTVDSTNYSPYTYNHGYVDPGDSWRTVMAYGNACSGCTRIPYWSNPDVLYFSQPMGIPEGQYQAADNRKTLNNTAFTVANFRTSCSPSPKADLIVESITTAPESPDAGQPFDLHVTVKNQGAADTGLFCIDWYADQASPPAPLQIGDESECDITLAAGASYTMTKTPAAYDYPTPNQYRMYAGVDIDDRVEELNENNNVLGPQAIAVGVCECDLNKDGSCNGQDWLLFYPDWGREDCNNPRTEPCECDLNEDGVCNGQDWLLFYPDWGRENCPVF
jgi:hypothetical protein